MVDHQAVVVALLNLCELLLEDLVISNNLGLFIEIKEIVSRLLKIAHEQQSFLLEVETYVLDSKVALLELDMDRARRLMTKAEIIVRSCKKDFEQT